MRVIAGVTELPSDARACNSDRFRARIDGLVRIARTVLDWKMKRDIMGK